MAKQKNNLTQHTMKRKHIIIAAASVLTIGGAITFAALQPTKATSDNGISIINAQLDSGKTLLHKRSYQNKTAQKSEDSLVDLTKAFYASGSAKINYSAPDTTVTTPTNPGTNPGGAAQQVMLYENTSNINLTAKTITAKALVFNNCKNVVINLCAFNGGKGTNLYALTLNNCTNVTVTNNFGTMYCNFVRVKGGSGIKINNNQFLNLYEPVLYNNDFAHAIRFESVTGAGNEIKDNAIENIQGQCVNPHDIINLVNCAGTSASHIIVSGNKIRGGMVEAKLLNSGATGAGITLDNGSYIDVLNNIGVRPGAAFIQANTMNGGTHSNILIDGNITVSLIKTSVSHDGYVALGSKTNVVFSNNKANWVNKNGATGTGYPGGEVLFWFGGSANPPGIKQVNNIFDKTLSEGVLPARIITYVMK